MRKGLALLLALTMMLAMSVSIPAMADDVKTIAGTPRDQTLVVECLDGQITNATQNNVYLTGTDVNNGLHQLVYANMWEVNTITGEVFGDLADGMPEALNKDYTSYKIKLRQGINWSDGVPFTADDVVFTINTLIEKKDSISGGARMATLVTKATKLSDYELQIDLVNPDPKIEQQFAALVWGNFFYPMPKHYFESHDLATDMYTNPLSLGPYTLKDRDPNGYWFLYEKRQDIKNSDVYAVTGKEPQPQYVLFTSFGTEEKKVMAINNNEVDILCDITPEAWEVVQNTNPDVKCWQPDYPYGCFDDPCERGIVFNNKVAPFDNPKVRWAMALSLDMVQASMDTFNGQMRVSPLCMPPTTFLSNDYFKPMRDWLMNYTWDDGYKPFDPDYATKLADTLKSNNVTDVVNNMTQDQLVELFGIGWWKHDPDKAEELLKAGGLSRGADNMWTYDGKKLSFEILAPSGYEVQSERLAYAVADQWRAFGFDVTVQACESSTFWTNWPTGNFTAGSYWPSCGVLDDLYSQVINWHSKYIVDNGKAASGNQTRFSSQKVDQMVEQLGKLPSADPQVHELGVQILQTLADECAWIPMFGTSKLVPTDNYYWTNYPDSANPYNGPWWWWSNFRYIMNEFQATGK